MATIVATAALVSIAIVPPIVWLFRCRVYDLFKETESPLQSAVWIAIIAVYAICAELWLAIRLRVLGESVMCWAMLFWLIYLWYRVIVVVSNRSTRAEPKRRSGEPDSAVSLLGAAQTPATRDVNGTTP